MARTIPFLIPMTVTVAANQSGNLSYTVPQTWVLHIYELYFTSTAAFRINQFSDSTGVNYSNVTQSVPILNTFLQNPGNSNLSLKALMHALELVGGQILTIQVQDTAGGSNTINCVANAVVDYPGNAIQAIT